MADPKPQPTGTTGAEAVLKALKRNGVDYVFANAGTDFPPIGDLPYLLTLPAYGFYWFQLSEAATVPTGVALVPVVPVVPVSWVLVPSSPAGGTLCAHAGAERARSPPNSQGVKVRLIGTSSFLLASSRNLM